MGPPPKPEPIRIGSPQDLGKPTIMFEAREHIDASHKGKPQRWLRRLRSKVASLGKEVTQ